MHSFKIKSFHTKSAEGLTIRGLILKPKEITGKLPAIIISHEFCMNMISTYRYARKIVNEGYIVAIYDFTRSGSGISGGSSIGMSGITESRDVKSVLEYVKILDCVDTDNIVLWGCSQGGFASAMIAPEVENDISKLILYYPALSIPDDARKGNMITTHFDPNVNIPDKFWCTIVHVGSNYCTDVINLSPFDEIAKFEKPVLLIHGKQDHIVNVEYSRKAAATYKNCEYHEINGVHMWLGGIGTKKALNYTKEFLRK